MCPACWKTELNSGKSKVTELSYMLRPIVNVKNDRIPSKSALLMELLCQFQQFAITSEENHKSDWENKAVCGTPVYKWGFDHWTDLIKIRYRSLY
jgi:hypothetical protein